MGLDQTLLTLFQVMTGDSWASMVARPVIQVQPWTWVFFVAFQAVAMLVLLNLVTAVIVENALEISKQDREMRLAQLREDQEQAASCLGDLFRELDVDNSGSIVRAEYVAAYKNRRVMEQLQLLGFVENDFPQLFDLIDMDGDGRVPRAEFVEMISRLQGEAKSADLVGAERRICRRIHRLERMLEHMWEQNGNGAGDHPLSKPLEEHHPETSPPPGHAQAAVKDAGVNKNSDGAPTAERRKEQRPSGGSSTLDREELRGLIQEELHVRSKF